MFLSQNEHLDGSAWVFQNMLSEKLCNCYDTHAHVDWQIERWNLSETHYYDLMWLAQEDYK